ncbi:MAG: DUF815 domain-containing protein [Acutalibacteraceae bacterium]
MSTKKLFVKEILDSLVVFKNLKYDPCLHSLYHIFDENSNIIKCYGDFIGGLIKSNLNLTEYIKEKVFSDENILTELVSSNKDISLITPQAKTELDNLYEISTLKKDDFSEKIQQNFSIFPSSGENFTDEYFERIKNINKLGFGIFADNHVFTVSNDGTLKPVESFNIRPLSEMYNYERERKKIIDNTQALVDGKPCCNVLLYGDAGTGKSSSIKAIANEFFKEGLRLIELNKTQITLIPNIVAKVANNPLKFIIFIDDVTFSTEDPDFCALKTILDGDSKGISDNIAVYVTSNHRHLIKETASERNGDLMHATDNIQGILGLTARFGLTITYLRPEKKVFEEIITSMAKEKGIECDENQLIIRAEAFATRNGGRTPRCAKQFIDLVYSGVEKI